MAFKKSLPPDFNELLLRLYRLSHEMPIGSFQDAVLVLLKTVLPFDSSMWGTATATPGGIDIHTIHLHRQTLEMIQAYEPLKHYDKVALAVMGKQRATVSYNSKSLFTEFEEREIRGFHQKFELENGFITAQTNANTGFVHWISLFRASETQHGTEDERLLLSQLAPHVMQALTMNRVMHIGRMDPGRPLERGSAIADLRGVVYHSDALFAEVLRREWTDWHGGLLPNALLQHFLLGHERFDGRSAVVTRLLEHSLLFLACRLRCRADSLTPREKTIAQLVARGETYKQIAQILERSPATVRNHIQSIYEKLAVSNIAGLIEELRLAG